MAEEVVEKRVHQRTSEATTGAEALTDSTCLTRP